MQRDIEIRPFNSIPNQEGTLRTIREEDGKYNSHTLFPTSVSELTEEQCFQFLEHYTCACDLILIHKPLAQAHLVALLNCVTLAYSIII